MYEVKIEPHRDGEMAGQYDIRVTNPADPERNLLVYSHQGYGNSSDAADLARKVFGSAAGVKLRRIRDLIDSYPDADDIEDAVRAILDDDENPTEHVDLIVVDWEGRGRTEPIR